MILDFLKLSVKNILHRKRRSWLTIIGIFIGIAAVVALVSLGQGLENSVNREFQAIGADKLFIEPGAGALGGGGGSGSASKLSEDDLNAVKRVKSVDNSIGILFRQSKVKFDQDSKFVTVLGVPTENNVDLIKNTFNIEMSKGRYIRSTDTSNVVIGSRTADEVFESDVNLRSKLELEGEEFRVVGVMEDTGDPGVDRGIIMELKESQDLLNADDEFDQIIAQAQTGINPNEVQKEVERELRNERNVDKDEEDFTVSTAQDLIDSVQNILGIVRAVVVGIASISLLVGGVGIMNTMYTSVTERTREIGVMKAIGAKNSDILTIFLLESGIMGFIGGALGVLIGGGMGITGAYFARQYSSIPIYASISWELVVGSLVFAFLTGTISGILPARRAATMDPADALRYE